jgi:hypothetical protein
LSSIQKELDLAEVKGQKSRANLFRNRKRQAEQQIETLSQAIEQIQSEPIPEL